MQKLTVYPNPFVALGADGMPCGRLHVEPGHPRPFDVIGGKLRRVRVERDEDRNRSDRERAMARRLDTRGPRVTGVATIHMRPIAIDGSQWVRERVGSGDLIAADKKSAAACGIDAKSFREPINILAAELKARIAEWTASHDDPPAVADYALGMVDGELRLVPPGAGVDAKEGQAATLVVPKDPAAPDLGEPIPPAKVSEKKTAKPAHTP